MVSYCTFNMDKVFESVSKHLSKDIIIEPYSSHSQHLLGNTNVVLWDKSSTSITPEVYSKFKDALNKRMCAWYTLNKMLSYPDFCIALLCSVEYTLNHNTMSKVESRTFKNAWRNLSIMTGIGDKDVQDWIKDRIQDRDATKYATTLGVLDPESPTASRKISFSIDPLNLSIDGRTIAKACSSKNIVEVYQNSNTPIFSILNKASTLPECQLDDLRITHTQFISK